MSIGTICFTVCFTVELTPPTDGTVGASTFTILGMCTIWGVYKNEIYNKIFYQPIIDQYWKFLDSINRLTDEQKQELKDAQESLAAVKKEEEDPKNALTATLDDVTRRYLEILDIF